MRRLILFTVLSLGLILAVGCNSNTNGKQLHNELKTDDSLTLTRYKDSLDWFFNYLLLDNDNFSGGILVAKNGHILYENYRGFADRTKKDSITAETPFHVASTSKTFTAIAILQLVEQGKLNFEDPLTKFFPAMPYPDLKVRHLLSHSSGITNYANLLPRFKWNTRKPATNNDVLHILFTHKPRLEFYPGTRFKYSNINFVILASLVERISGERFPDYIQKHIFDVAGMSNSYVYSETTPRSLFMDSYFANGRLYGFNYLDNLYGDKNVYTTCRDLFKYDSVMYSGGLVKKELLDAAQLPYYMDHRNRDTLEYYGLGFRLKVFNDSTKIAYHNGWWHGNNAVFQRLINEGVTIIVTGSRFNRKIYDATLVANIFAPYYKDEYIIEVDSGETEGGSEANKKE